MSNDQDYCCNCGKIIPEEIDEKLADGDITYRYAFYFYDGWLQLFEGWLKCRDDEPTFLYLCPGCVEKMRQQLNQIHDEIKRL